MRQVCEGPGEHPRAVGAVGIDLRLVLSPVMHIVEESRFVRKCHRNLVTIHRGILTKVNTLHQRRDERLLGMDGVVEHDGGVILKGRVRDHHLAHPVETLAVGAAVGQTGVEGVVGSLHHAAVLAHRVSLVDGECLKFRIIENKRLAVCVKRRPGEDLQFLPVAIIQTAILIEGVGFGDKMIGGLVRLCRQVCGNEA